MRQARAEAFGPYLIHEVIGIGGMASVHRAEKPGEIVTVALKRMLPQFAVNDEAVAAFIREARLAGLMSHPNVARTYESGRIDDTYFIAMELITGRTLGELVRQASITAPMPLGVVLNLAIQICEALAYAHTLADETTNEPLGIIHRDVSPSNVIVTDDGVAKLIDFGVAKGATMGMQTQGATMKGKFAYMAPEYLYGRIDSRADIFAAGIMVHELLSNVPLFAGVDEIDTMNKVRDMPIPRPSELNGMVPSELDAIVMGALERDPEQRWQHASQLRDAFVEAARALGIRTSNSVVVQWMAETFGETVTFDSTPIAATSIAPPREDLELIPAAPVVKFARPSTPPPFSPSLAAHVAAHLAAPAPVAAAPRSRTPSSAPIEDDSWGNTSINSLIRAGTDLGLPGSEPLSLDELEPPARAATPLPVVVEDKPLPPPSVIVVAPERSKRVWVLLALLVVAGGAAAAYYFLLR